MSILAEGLITVAVTEAGHSDEELIEVRELVIAKVTAALNEAMADLHEAYPFITVVVNAGGTDVSG